MFGIGLTPSSSLIFLLLTILATVHAGRKPAFNCKGGSIYFAAHPADVLLYMNPDIFHDLYVYKCTTTVIFTSGDRGIRGNYSRSLERGFENAFAWMTAQKEDESSWSSTDVQFNGQVVLVRSLKKMPTTQLVYFRLPNSAPDGQAYAGHDGQSLKKLYDGSIGTLDSTDGSATYTLDELKDLVSTILQKREAKDIRILDHKTPVPQDGETERDHADHTISARLVAEVIEHNKIKGIIQGYACGSTRTMEPTLSESDFRVKTDAYVQYAQFDNFTCPQNGQCEFDVEEGPEQSDSDNDDTHYITKWLEREYYVQ